MYKSKVSPEVWAVRKPQKLKTEKTKYSVQEEDPFFEQIKYALYMCRLLGWIPFERTKSGDFRFRLCSPVMVFTLLINGIQVYLTYLVYRSHLAKLLRSNETYDDAVKLVLMLVLLNIHFYAVVFIFLETGKISNYLNHWKQFNKKFECHLKGLSTMKYQVLWLVLVLLILMVVGTIVETQYLLIGLPWHFSIPYFTVAYRISLAGLQWYINCIIFSRLGRIMIEHLFKVVKKNPYPEDIYYIRCMWQELRSLVKDFEKSHATSVYYGMGIAFIIITLASYGTLLGLFEKSINNLGSYLIPLLFFLIIMYIACDGPHRLHDKLGSEVINALLSCKLTHLKKETRQEIIMFLDTIEADPPVIAMRGYFISNRKIFTAAISTAVTYLVVLVQFKISSLTGKK